MRTIANQSQKDLTSALTQVISTRNPQVIYGENEPVAVILDYTSYNVFLSLLDELEEKGRYLDAAKEAKGKRGISLDALKKKYHLK